MDNRDLRSKLRPSKRRLIQLYAALLYNANIKGFVTGRIYTGKTKYLCVPGLNCYSCPGAVGSCPLGSLQNALASSKTSSLAYISGILILSGLLLGRTICGFLCPMGLIQELLHKIPSPKLKKNRFTRVLSYFKYVILLVLVILVPLVYSGKLPVPGFCKYICPSGTLLGALGLLSNEKNAELFGMLGPLFTWKFSLLVIICVACVFIFRFFCRFFCPLGAIYGFFCRLALIGVKLDRDKCISCGLCLSVCKMDIRHVGDHECISCGACVPVCPVKAISYNGSKYFIPTEAALSVDATVSGKEAVETAAAKASKRAKVLKITAVVLAAAVLITALLYYNFFIPENYSYGVGEFCPAFSLAGIDGDSDVTSAGLSGKFTVINFWAVWCTPCVAELPHFDKLASEYPDIVVLAVNADTYEDGFLTSKGLIDSEIIFVQDAPQEEYGGKTLMQLIGGSETLPITVVLDADGKIVYRHVGGMTYGELLNAVGK